MRTTATVWSAKLRCINTGKESLKGMDASITPMKVSGPSRRSTAPVSSTLSTTGTLTMRGLSNLKDLKLRMSPLASTSFSQRKSSDLEEAKLRKSNLNRLAQEQSHRAARACRTMVLHLLKPVACILSHLLKITTRLNPILASTEWLSSTIPADQLPLLLSKFKMKMESTLSESGTLRRSMCPTVRWLMLTASSHPVTHSVVISACALMSAAKACSRRSLTVLVTKRWHPMPTLMNRSKILLQRRRSFAQLEYSATCLVGTYSLLQSLNCWAGSHLSVGFSEESSRSLPLYLPLSSVSSCHC